MNYSNLDGWSELETDLQWIFQITGDNSQFYGKWDYSYYPGNMMLYDVTTQTLLGSMNSAPGEGFSYDLEDGHRYLLDIDTYFSGYESDSRIWEFGFSNIDINVVEPSMLARNVAEPSILALMIAGSLPLILFNFRSSYCEPI